MLHRRWWLVVSPVVVAAACSSFEGGDTPSSTAEGGVDGGGTVSDAGTDARPSIGTEPDAGASDGSVIDASTPYTGPLRVFVTSLPHDGKFGGVDAGLEGADNFCQGLAAQAKLGGRWVAWLSTSTTDAASRLLGAKDHAFVLVHDAGPLFAANAFGPGGTVTPFNAMSVDETGATVADAVWTGTGPDGRKTPLGPPAPFCNEWSTNVNGNNVAGETGDSANKMNWSASNTSTCDVPHRVFCFELL